MVTKTLANASTPFTVKSFFATFRLKIVLLFFKPSESIVNPGSPSTVDLKFKNYIIFDFYRNSTSFGTAFSPILFFEVFSIFPMSNDIRDLCPVSCLNAIFDPCGVRQF